MVLVGMLVWNGLGMRRRLSLNMSSSSLVLALTDEIRERNRGDYRFVRTTGGASSASLGRLACSPVCRRHGARIQSRNGWVGRFVPGLGGSTGRTRVSVSIPEVSVPVSMNKLNKVKIIELRGNRGTLMNGADHGRTLVGRAESGN